MVRFRCATSSMRSTPMAPSVAKSMVVLERPIKTIGVFDVKRRAAPRSVGDGQGQRRAFARRSRTAGRRASTCSPRCSKTDEAAGFTEAVRSQCRSRASESPAEEAPGGEAARKRPPPSGEAESEAADCGSIAEFGGRFGAPFAFVRAHARYSPAMRKDRRRSSRNWSAIYDQAVATLRADIAAYAADGTLPPPDRRADRAWCYPELRIALCRRRDTAAT